jgi:hypothetical protein
LFCYAAHFLRAEAELCRFRLLLTDIPLSKDFGLTIGAGPISGRRKNIVLEDFMKTNVAWAIALSLAAVVVISGTAGAAKAADEKTPYPAMAPLDKYLIADRNSEIALARSAAPDAISRDAEIQILGRHGYEVAVKGKNGFVCMVQRSWTSGFDSPDFWNPKLMAPICYNAPAARSYYSHQLRRTELALAGRSRDEISAAIAAAISKKDLPQMESGAMCYMMSKQGYLNDRAGHWHPHLMFFAPQTEDVAWGANADGSPVLATTDPVEHLTIFMVPVWQWSDGTPDTELGH